MSKSKFFFLLLLDVFQAEKIHENTPEADPIEKQAEIDRMRQHVITEFDKNNDRMLSFDEFQLGINGTDAKNEQGWQVSFFNCVDSTTFDYFLLFFSSQLKIVPFTVIKNFKIFQTNSRIYQQ